MRETERRSRDREGGKDAEGDFMQRKRQWKRGTGGKERESGRER